MKEFFASKGIYLFICHIPVIFFLIEFYFINIGVFLASCQTNQEKRKETQITNIRSEREDINGNSVTLEG